MAADEAYRQLMVAHDMLLPWALATTVELGIPELIGDGRASAGELADKADANPAALRGLLRYLTVCNVLVEHEPGVFALGPLGAALRADVAAGPGALFDPDAFPFRVQLAWRGLPEAIRTGRPGYEHVHGRSFWDDMSSDAARGAGFDAKMAMFTSRWIPSVVSRRSWPDYRHVVDVGGGNASMAIALLQAAPALRATIVDLPATAAIARRNLAAANVAERCEVMAGSFFDPLPAGADVYVLAQIIHDWPDEQAVRILRRCAEAAGPDGHVFVMDRVLAEKATDPMHEEVNLLMFNMFGSTERTAREFGELTAAADLKITTIDDLALGFSLIDCVPVP